MKISGFTIACKAVLYGYPIVPSIRSLLPLCDELIVNVGRCDDGTLELVRSIGDPKIRILESTWDFSAGPQVLSVETNRALAACAGDWAVYLQSDEVLHEADLPALRRAMERYHHAPDVDALRFKWLHFYGSYTRYRIDAGWYQKQDRIIRNNGTVESFGDAFGFRRKDGAPLRRKNTGCYIYHYGWVQSPEIMASRRKNAAGIGFVQLTDKERTASYDFGDLNRFPPYFGSHPAVMRELIAGHEPSRADRDDIRRRYWWHPMRVLKARYKTSRRVSTRIP